MAATAPVAKCWSPRCADDRHRPSSFRPRAGGQEQREVEFVVALHRRSLRQRPHRWYVLSGNPVFGRDVDAVRDRSHRIGDVAKNCKVNGCGGEARRAHSRVLAPHDACHVRQVEDRALAVGTEQEIRGSWRAVLDLIANSLHHRRDALRRVDAGGHDVALAHAQAPSRHESPRGAPACISLARSAGTGETPRSPRPAVRRRRARHW